MNYFVINMNYTLLLQSLTPTMHQLALPLLQQVIYTTHPLGGLIKRIDQMPQPECIETVQCNYPKAKHNCCLLKEPVCIKYNCGVDENYDYEEDDDENPRKHYIEGTDFKISNGPCSCLNENFVRDYYTLKCKRINTGPKGYKPTMAYTKRFVSTLPLEIIDGDESESL